MPDEIAADPKFSLYDHNPAIGSFSEFELSFSIGKISFRSDPTDDFIVKISNNNFSPDSLKWFPDDSLSISTSFVSDSISEKIRGFSKQMDILLRDSSGMALSSDALPTAFDVAEFDVAKISIHASAAGITNRLGASRIRFSIEANIKDITPVPEPPSEISLLIGMLIAGLFMVKWWQFGTIRKAKNRTP